MRLTLPLCFPRMWVRMRGAAWYKHRKRSITEDGNFQRITEAGYNVVDANEYIKPMSPLYLDYDSLPELAPRFPVPPANDETNPDWHGEICKLFDDSVFPIEGIQQALAFTKGVRLSSGLPESILEKVKSLEVSEEDDLMAQQCVQQAFIWDGYLQKLPKLRHLDYPSLNPRAVYGTPWKRKNEILVNNFLRIIEKKVPLSISLSRMICPQEELRINFTRHGSRIQFRLNPIGHILSTNPVNPICTKLQVEETSLLPLTDIYPFLSTANLEEVNVYKEDDHFAVKPGSKFSQIHTSFFSHHIPGSHTHIHPRWNDDRFAGTTIFYNFATALTMAKRKFGPNVQGDLPEPITTQVIHLTGKEFQFSVFQLNTLNLEDSTTTGVKNHVWITDKMDLFTEVSNYYGKEIFEGYNPEIFKIVSAMYLS